MTHAALSLRPRRTALLSRVWSVRADPWIVAVIGLAAFAFAIRLVAADQQSAYMDEGTNVITGRMLIEQHAVYAEVLNWAYGSYLWPLVAGVADMLGGLAMVRAVTAVCGVVMVLATALAASRLAPASLSRERRWGVALTAGGVMAVAPTAIAVSRFGTYDALAGAGFMAGVALLLPVSGARPRWQLLAAAGLLFVAFLAKYLVAIYFPLVCIYVVGGALRTQPRLRQAIHNFVWFVLPLSVLCAGYPLLFLSPLLTLLTSSLRYGDLKSADPFREYVLTRPEIWLLVVLAVLGARRATWTGRAIAFVGVAVIAAFQLVARPDFDFWKHSIYVIFFLAPLAGLVWLRIPQHTGSWRVVGALGAAACALLVWNPTVQQADAAINFYPNFNPSLSEIQTAINGSALVLTDDTALRYYLYQSMGTDRVVGPFFFTYQSQSGVEAYRRAIADRYFDALVLDGGVTPQGNAITDQLDQTIQQSYQPVYTHTEAGFTIEVLKPLRPAGVAGQSNAEATYADQYTFDAGAAHWGAHTESGRFEPGQQITIASAPDWNGHPTLRFAPSASASIASLERVGRVSRVRAHIYAVPSDGSTSPIRVGFIGFDTQWQWHDDGFRWLVTPATWTTVTWDLTDPADFVELGLKLPTDIGAVYVGSFEVDP